MTKVKSIETNNFEIQLLQSDSSGLYYVAHVVGETDQPQMSEGMLDFNSATFVFDEILRKLEGH